MRYSDLNSIGKEMDYVRASRVNNNLAEMLKIDLHLPSSS